MSRPNAILASGIFTLFLLSVIAVAVIWSARANTTDSATDAAALQSVEDQQTAYQASVEQAQAAMAEREAEYQARLAELERLAQEREAEYQARLEEADAQIGNYQTQFEQMAEGTAAHQAQITELEQALQERYTLFEARRQEFEVQRKERLGQLQAQLAEGKTKLQEANAQLGR